MRKNILFFGILGCLTLDVTAIAHPKDDSVADDIQKLSTEIMLSPVAYNNLRELTTIGPRLSGSDQAQRAIEWAKAKMESYGLVNVRLQPAIVPHWVRGTAEQATIIETSGNHIDLKLTALGGSEGTESSGILAEVIEVHSLNEVEQRRTEIPGKIVFYNRPMDPKATDPFAAYDGAFDQRYSGPATAARYGAVGVLVRSLTLLTDDDHPHTGSISAEGRKARIPSAALSTHAANTLATRLKTDGHLKIHLTLSSKNLPDVTSYNVIGEIKGSEKPEEIIVVGGHLDSWDLGVGAHDDGAGVVESLEILRAMKTLGIVPKRTIRVVFFAAEELGGHGGNEYARQASSLGEKHILALESDRGGYAPQGFGVDAKSNILQKIQSWKHYFKELHADAIVAGEGGTDIGPLGSLGVPLIGFIPDPSHYFDRHHSVLDQLDAVKNEELTASAAAMATMIYLVAEQGL